ncbi:hypothetical protein A2767_02130 [Candidatus Roizmanbacteria bacterium RIFCSPHIGHO2_01_FULL_35_10]|uniref:DUF4349 domain-containing protein n=1 Tax=Candidatus Roizmanbacteria bacterium RIFCSPLOWO2_01_FULL_35_13 TaxID=1802055 RepID=A0A1F7I7A9_9BACT|nr:MAG: hypothetical protein A2767_02130 [Candidatus Roizmanbacteria bacterium RIFCSPHIGHO2_01_FULL_35_10]OGK39259.1 MAG: hypothetical protein A3A74_07550 [Candidatus Roizmanbacteria bacterium RIFCSPLOWO2_01_FULL_35_13]
MSRFFNWIKNNKLTFVLLIVVAYFIYNKYSPQRPIPYDASMSFQQSEGVMNPSIRSMGKVGIGGYGGIVPPAYEAAPAPDVANRLVVSESYLSILVKNVIETQKQIIQTAENLGGYMVNSNLSNPQDAPTATLTVRVPEKRLNEALQLYRDLSVKVVSENLTGQDVTDQFVDNEARLKTLEDTKAKFQEIFDQATRIEDILNVQQQIINLQSQIDSVKGQQNYLEKNAQMAKLTVYLSTDEFALPYAPSESWRPEVIFKQAVRSLVSHVRKLGTALIWLAVYSTIVVPALLLIRYFIKKR